VSAGPEGRNGAKFIKERGSKTGRVEYCADWKRLIKRRKNHEGNARKKGGGIPLGITPREI